MATIPPSAEQETTAPHRLECYRCHKPAQLCVCSEVTRVDNQTSILILQHPRERFHPIGTARFAELGLSRVRSLVSWSEAGRSVSRDVEVGPDVGLLYPHPEARALGTLRPSERPRELIVLDGTWHHAHTLYRENPWLHSLPHYGLTPDEPSRYRIRKEPRAECVSTLEAIVHALRLLEPELQGLDQLIAAFDRMIDTQIRYASTGEGGRRRKRKRIKESRAIPKALLEDFKRLVVVCGEASARPDDSALDALARRGKARCSAARANDFQSQLLYWVAVRPATGERFASLIKPEQAISERHLMHLGLRAEDFAAAPELGDALAAWREFQRPDDIFAAWNQSTWDMLLEANASGAPLGPLRAESRAQSEGFVLLKGPYFNVRRGAPRGDLDSLLEYEGLEPVATGLPGRAGRRLGNTLRIVDLLREIAGATQPST